MLSAEAIEVTNNKKILLSKVSVSFACGEFCVVMGPNGAGKTTLLRSLCGQIKPSKGQITLRGKSLDLYSSKERARQIAHLSQTNEVAFNFSVEEVVSLGRYAHHSSRAHHQKIIQDALEELDLSRFRKRSYALLSGGEKQRVQLARVLVQIDSIPEQGLPRWLLLDEYHTHLDIAHQYDILNRLKRRTDLGIVAIIHDFNLALTYADRVILIHSGSVAHQGKPNDVLTPEKLHPIFDINFEKVQTARGSLLLPV